jgi:hypothetical protein
MSIEQLGRQLRGEPLHVAQGLGDRIVTVELVIPMAAGVIGARFGRLMGWPFPPRMSRWPHKINARYDLSNAMFWAIFTSLVVNSAITIIEHI